MWMGHRNFVLVLYGAVTSPRNSIAKAQYPWVEAPGVFRECRNFSLDIRARVEYGVGVRRVRFSTVKETPPSRASADGYAGAGELRGLLNVEIVRVAAQIGSKS